ncbi:MAG: heme ABC exporter ATP-binding protein CcmA, partial [Parvularculaceae bacterium]|nr:heme ABC exporter ATP-binding protein CcmA [Parvularculaceae bacterium]
LRGPNGVGKSTFLKCLAGLIRPSTGSIEFQGANPEDDVPPTTFLGHKNGLKSAMTVQETLLFWTKVYAQPMQRIGGAISYLRLEPFKTQYISNLSAGQQRRVALARPFISRRPIWLLDEPTTGIDIDNISKIERLIESHCELGGAALIATHEPISISGATTINLQMDDVQ